MSPYAFSLSSKEISLEVKEIIIRLNPWVELVESTSNVTLRISTGFQRDFPKSKRVIIRVNPWVVVVPLKSLWNSEMCSVTLAVIWTNSTHGFTLISYLVYFQEHFNHEFTQITLLLARESLWKLVNMRSMTLEVV